MKKCLLIIVSLFILSDIFSQVLTPQEKELYNLISEYRKSNNLPDIPVSKSLTVVAQTHVKDLEINKPVSEKCTLHSWSSKGEWKAVCYTGDRKSAEGMWNKPRELTSYKADGYEIAFYSSSGVKVEDALNSWKKSKNHNDVILNKEMWERSNWKSVGVGVYGKYAVIWFGVEPD